MAWTKKDREGVLAKTGGESERLHFKANGSIEARFGYFYRHGMTCKKAEQHVLACYPDAQIASSSDSWNPWPKDSYFSVIFRLPGLPTQREPKAVKAAAGPSSLSISYAERRERNSGSLKDYNKNPRVYFWPKDETVLQNLENRHSRPVTEYRKLLPQVLEQLGITAGEAVWSQRAGCGCGCSPGFILKGTSGHYDIHVEVK